MAGSSRAGLQTPIIEVELKLKIDPANIDLTAIIKNCTRKLMLDGIQTQVMHLTWATTNLTTRTALEEA